MHRAIPAALSNVVSLFRGANGENSSPPNRFSDNSVLSVVIDGKKFQIPRYKPEVRLTDERYEFEQDAVERITKKMTKLAKNAIINERNSVYLFFSAVNVLIEMKAIRYLNRDLMSSDTPYPLSSGFGETNGQMLYRMIKKARREKLETLTDFGAYKRLELVLEAVEKLTAMSNTGLNLDWTKLKINGENVEQYLMPSMIRLARRFVMYDLLKTASHLIKDRKYAGNY